LVTVTMGSGDNVGDGGLTVVVVVGGGKNSAGF
jgi:hypothetical protein